MEPRSCRIVCLVVCLVSACSSQPRVVEDESGIGADPSATPVNTAPSQPKAPTSGVQATTGTAPAGDGMVSGQASAEARSCAADGGEGCACDPGFEMKEGLCLASDGASCGDDLDCANGHCEGGICCARACNDPDAECRTTEGATCADGKTCVYPVAADGAACDDGNACVNGSTCKAGACQAGTERVNCDDQNDCTDDSCDTTFGCKNQNNTKTCDDNNACTSNDRCNLGVCGGTTTLDCGTSADACNSGSCEPTTGKCAKKPLPDGTPCDDKDSCTAADACAAGSCKGGEKACGPNSTACTAGIPNRCTCGADYVASQGMCVPRNDECGAKPCDANATCFDPSSAANDVTCKCKSGFSGDGKACAATESCDLKGTFAGHILITSNWPSDPSGLEAATGATSETWVLERHEVDANGVIEAQILLCGELLVDVCATVLGTSEAYTQWFDRKFYDDAVSTARYRWKPFEPAPSAAFETDNFALYSGIQLDDPLGAWPANRKQVQGGPAFSGTAVNGARWVDSDGDSFIGLTTYTVGPEGVSATGDGPRPLKDFGMRSDVCPRGSNAARYPYANIPAPEGVSIRRIKRLWSASRVIEAFKGKLDDCDSYSGEMIGPSGGFPQLDDVFGNCIRQNGSGEAPCSDALVESLDQAKSSAAGRGTASASVIFKRVADETTCAGVRTMKF